jgi:hypothetical protein
MDKKEFLSKFSLLAQEYMISEYESLVKDYTYAVSNRDRFLDYLIEVADYLDVDWWDGEFPLEEVKQKILFLRNHRS